MTTIVRRIKAGHLPPELRGDFDPEHEVEVSVSDLDRRVRRVTAARNLRGAIEDYRRRTGATLLSEEEVRERVREARGEEL